MGMQESGEMYLETIYVLNQKNGNARSVDVSDYLGYSKPSVSRGVGILKKEGYVTVEADGTLVLTERGAEKAQKIYARHTLLTRVLTAIGVSPETAAADACRLEHAVSDESFEALKKYAETHFKEDN